MSGLNPTPLHQTPDRWKLITRKVQGMLIGAAVGGLAIYSILIAADAEYLAGAYAIIAGIGGACFGAALAGGRIGRLGWSVLIGAFAGAAIGALGGVYKNPVTIAAALIGLLAGLAVGVRRELRHGDR